MPLSLLVLLELSQPSGLPVSGAMAVLGCEHLRWRGDKRDSSVLRSYSGPSVTGLVGSNFGRLHTDDDDDAAAAAGGTRPSVLELGLKHSPPTFPDRLDIFPSGRPGTNPFQGIPALVAAGHNTFVAAIQ
eukprot:COSAG05_NODE_5027_length_1286_cov_14.727885_1_plen_129_part_10